MNIILSIILIIQNILFIHEINSKILILQFILIGISFFRKYLNQFKLVNWILLIVCIFVNYKIYPNYREAESIISFIILLSGLKNLELITTNDYYHLFLLTNLSSASLLILKPEFLIFIFSLITVFVTFYLVLKNNLVKLNSLDFTKILTFIIPAVGLSTFLYFFFPRIGSGFNQNQFMILSGFNKELSLNELGPIELSDAKVFEFYPENTKIQQKDLYFRNYVLWDTDGINWFSRNYQEEYVNPIFEPNTFNYKIILEDPTQNHINTFDKTFDIDLEHSKMNRDFTFIIRNLKNYKKIFSGIGHKNAKDLYLTESIKKRALRIKGTPNDFLSKIVKEKILKNSKSNDEIVQNLKSYFENENFKYSIKPPLYKNYEEFAEQKVGYCSHYATYATILLRMANVPTRTISGYQGGEYNTIGNFYTIKEKDAHLWIEYYSNITGWTKVDPTAWIAPLRIEEGILAVGDGKSKNPYLKNNLGEAFNKLNETLAYINLQLSIKFYDFDSKKQLEYFKNLPITINSMKYYLISGFFIIFFIFWLFYYFMEIKINIPEYDRTYLRFIKKMKKHGIIKLEHEPPLAFKQRCLENLPEQKPEIENVFKNFLKKKYSKY